VADRDSLLNNQFLGLNYGAHREFNNGDNDIICGVKADDLPLVLHQKNLSFEGPKVKFLGAVLRLVISRNRPPVSPRFLEERRYGVISVRKIVFIVISSIGPSAPSGHGDDFPLDER
jgi:hypothetical protein